MNKKVGIYAWMFALEFIGIVFLAPYLKTLLGYKGSMSDIPIIFQDFVFIFFGLLLGLGIFVGSVLLGVEIRKIKKKDWKGFGILSLTFMVYTEGVFMILEGLGFYIFLPPQVWIAGMIFSWGIFLFAACYWWGR